MVDDVDHVVQIFERSQGFVLSLHSDPFFEVLIVLGLAFAQRAVVVVDDFFREFFEDVALHAPHDEGHHFIVQFFKGLALVIREEEFVFLESGQVDFEEFFVVFFEEFFGVEIAGHEEVEEAPEFYEAVLDGSASEDETVQSFQLLDGFEFESFDVFDEMSFVQDQELHIDFFKNALVLLHDAVASDEDNGVVRLLPLLHLSELLLVVNHEDLADRVLKVLTIFERPMLHQRVRTNDQTVQVVFPLS